MAYLGEATSVVLESGMKVETSATEAPSDNDDYNEDEDEDEEGVGTASSKLERCWASCLLLLTSGLLALLVLVLFLALSLDCKYSALLFLALSLDCRYPARRSSKSSVGGGLSPFLDFAEMSATEAPSDNDGDDDEDDDDDDEDEDEDADDDADDDDDDEGDEGDEDVGTAGLLAGKVATSSGCGEGTKSQIRHHGARCIRRRRISQNGANTPFL
jgi:hypothetical protein